MRRSRAMAGILCAASLGGLFAGQPASPRELSLPARLQAYLEIRRGAVDDRTAGTTKAVGDLLGIKADPEPTLGEGPMTSAIVSIEIRRWTLGEEREALAAAFRTGKTAGLAKEMGRYSLGDLHLDSELRVPIRVAVTWITPVAQRVQLAFNRRVIPSNPAHPLAQHNEVIQILDLSLPHGEPFGDGTLVTATQVDLQEPGLIALVVPESGSRTSPLTHVERQPAKPR